MGSDSAASTGPPQPEAAAAASDAAAAAAAAAPDSAEQPSTSQPSDNPGDSNPMLQTSLTRRFRGRYQPLQMPSFETMMQEDMMNNCGVKSVIAGVMGGLLGVAFGVFTASLDTQVRARAGMHAAAAGTWCRCVQGELRGSRMAWAPAGCAARRAIAAAHTRRCARRRRAQGIDAAPLGETKPTRVVLRETWQLMKEKSRSYSKGFAGMGFLYSGTECLIEKYRAKHDKWNTTLAGCATGGLMAAPGAEGGAAAATRGSRPRACACMARR